MTQADRVLGTPPTNTSAYPYSRRGFLVQSAVTIAEGALLGAALPLPSATGAFERAFDPIFDLIESHRRADATHRKALNVQARFERRVWRL